MRRRPDLMPAVAVLLPAIVTPAFADDAEKIARGKTYSEQHCARCHVVGDYNKYGGIGSTPSFRILVKRRPDFADRFMTFHVRRPHPSFVRIKGFVPLNEKLPPAAAPVELPIEALDEILAYAKTLAKPGK